MTQLALLRLFLLQLSFLVLAIFSWQPRTSAQDGQPTGLSINGQVLGLNSSIVRSQTIEVDFRTLTNPDLLEEVLTIEVTYRLECLKPISVNRLVILTDETSKISHLRLDSNSLAFTPRPVDEKQIEADWDLKLRGASQILANEFLLEIPSGKHEFSFGLRVTPISKRDQQYRCDFRIGETLANIPLEFRCKSPTDWQMRSSWFKDVRYDSADEFYDSAPNEPLWVSVTPVKIWTLNTNFVDASGVYEFDRRFSITGWIALAAIIVLSFIMATLHLVKGQRGWMFIGSALICLIAIGGLTAGFVLPSQTNQMRTIRQQDHDQLLQIANRLISRQAELSLGNPDDVSNPPSSIECYQLLVALARQGAMFGKSSFYTVDDSRSKPSGTQSNQSYMIVLEDAPKSIAAIELDIATGDSDGTTVSAIKAVHLDPIPTKVQLDRRISNSDLNKGQLHFDAFVSE